MNEIIHSNFDNFGKNIRNGPLLVKVFVVSVADTFIAVNEECIFFNTRFNRKLYVIWKIYIIENGEYGVSLYVI